MNVIPQLKISNRLKPILAVYVSFVNYSFLLFVFISLIPITKIIIPKISMGSQPIKQINPKLLNNFVHSPLKVNTCTPKANIARPNISKNIPIKTLKFID